MFFLNRKEANEKLQQNPLLPLAVWKASTGEGYGVIVKGKGPYIVRFNENLGEKIESLEKGKLK